TINLIATNDLNSVFGALVENKIISTILKIIILVFIVLFVGLLYIRMINIKKRRKKIFNKRKRI
ncbi:MAG: D-alanyl-D-alanine carboxypeptidase, partial [Romboutsia sp.]|nr:D-alanyl-D-alanine carboxypeptidase [Romboutsia sp.]